MGHLNERGKRTLMVRMSIVRTIVYRVRITSGGDMVFRARRVPIVRLT